MPKKSHENYVKTACKYHVKNLHLRKNDIFPKKFPKKFRKTRNKSVIRNV